MRTIRLLPLMAAATAALVLAPASALARRQAQTMRACHIRLEAPKTLAADEPATITGQLKCPSVAEPGSKQITLYERPAPQTGFTALTPVISNAKGEFEVTPLLKTDTTFYAVSEGARSAQRTVRVAALVTPEAPTPAEGAQLLTGDGDPLQQAKRVAFAGSVEPYYHGEHVRVVLQRESSTGNEEWRAIQVAEVEEGGKYHFEHRFLVPGEANIRVVAHPFKYNSPSASTPFSYEISQVQNTALTLETSGDPLSYGQSVKLKGAVQGATSAPTSVTLLERTRKGSLVPVASTETVNGAYEFVRTPQQNAIYRVTTKTAKSSLLFEGVKHQLTFTPPAGPVAVGTPLEFTGSVLPAGEVYLERQNAGQLGWHVIESTTGPENSFTLHYAFKAPGTVLLRIKVRGGEGHQAIASAPFKLEVTAAPPSALTPEAPSKVHLPSEGQL